MTELLRRATGSVRTRILTAFVVLLAASTVISTVALRELLVNRAIERIDERAARELDDLRRLALDGRHVTTGRPLGNDVAGLFDTYMARNLPVEGEGYYSFVDGRAHRRLASTELDDDVTRQVLSVDRTGRGRSGELTSRGRRLRYAVVPIRNGGRVRGSFVIVDDLSREERAATRSARSFAGVAALVLVFATGIAFLVAGRVLRPLRTLRETATAISETDLSRRLEIEGDDELAELARTFNAMLDRLEAALDSQRAFLSDAGHELRTPITIISGHLELLGDDPRERRETIALVTDELDRMSRFVDDLLTLAKSEREDFLHPELLDLDELAEKLHAKAQALGDRRWVLERGAPGQVVADRQRLTQAVMNLAGNAVSHTGVGAEIAIGASVEGGAGRLWVRDGGPGIAPADAERIFERFTRGDQRRRDGAGLGLAIVKAIAEAHGGRVELDSAPGLGARFSLVIPEVLVT